MSYSRTARYTESEILTRSPEWLVPLLFEHLLAAMRRAVVQIEIADREGRAASLGRASAIIGELLASLDRENGGEIAENLARIYTYMATQLLDVAPSGGVGSLPQLIELAGELHEAWVSAAEAVAPRGQLTRTANW